MQIPLSLPDLSKREKIAVMEILKSGRLSLGPATSRFESLMAAYVGMNYAVTVNSGTSGLHLVVRGLGIGEGDEVITTPFSFVASANCLLFERARPVFVDIENRTMNIDAGMIEQKINSRTKAILAVHVFGHPAEMEFIVDLASKYGLFIIEDACEALGSRYKGKMAGSYGDAAVFAFYPNKQITTGEGGVVLTNHEELAVLCRSMRNQGREESGGWYEHNRLGYNYRMDEMSAALGCVQLERIQEILAKRKAVAEKYSRKLRGIEGVFLPHIRPEIEMSWFVYVIRLDSRINRDWVMAELTGKGIGCRPYFQPIHLQPFYIRAFGFSPGDFPVTEAAAASTLALPFYNNMPEAEIDYVVDCLKEIVMNA